MKPSVFNVISKREIDGSQDACPAHDVDIQSESSDPPAVKESAAIQNACAEECVIFNSFNGAFAQIDESVASALESGALDNLAEDEVDALSTAGFLVPDEFDEFVDFERAHVGDMNTTDFLSLCIAPTMQCNLRCLYCYEEHENVRLTPEVEDAIMRFIERRYEAYHFKLLRILWYGGEPLLELDAMERLSQRMIAWTQEHNVEYSAQIITNATLIDDETARRMAAMHIAYAMPTLDGCELCHDKRRVHIDGRGSFAETEAGIHALANAGIDVGLSSNMDKTLLQSYRELEACFKGLPHIDPFASHLRTYNDWITDDLLKQGDFDVFTRDEFARAQFELYAEQHPSAASIHATLRPRRSFCQGKMASYFVIDPEGNVYRCDGHMRESDWVLFNLLQDDYSLDWPETKTLSERNERCQDCSLVPICLGQCDWEWDQFGENCTPAKYVIDDYLWLLYDALDKSPSEERFDLLIEPRDMSDFFATPLRHKGLME